MKRIKMIKALYNFSVSIIMFGIIFISTFPVLAQEAIQNYNRDSVIAAAREIMGMQNYCALITLDSAGLPNVRTMNPYPLEEDITIWMATNRESRKVKEIRDNKNVCIYYADHKSPSGYVAINGEAIIIDNKELLVKKKREYWEQAVPDWKDVLVLIKIIPQKLEVVNYKYKMYGDSVTWKSPFIQF